MCHVELQRSWLISVEDDTDNEGHVMSGAHGEEVQRPKDGSVGLVLRRG